jgi:hypothetical protein
MMAAGIQNLNRQAVDYLEALRSLADEIEKAMQAVARNSLADFEESLAAQQLLSTDLLVLRGELAATLEAHSASSVMAIEAELLSQIFVASEILQGVNRCYAALIQHSSRSAAQMALLFSSFQGKLQEASGPGLKQQTWSCQM